MSDAERIVLVKWSPSMAVFCLGITAVFWVVPLLYLLIGSDRGLALVLHWLAVVVLALPFLWVVWRVPKTLRGMGLTIDAAGIHPFDGGTVDTIGWHEIAAVGYGSYRSARRRQTAEVIAGLEIYLTDPAYTAGHPRLRNDWHEVASPAPGLSAGCYRYSISPYTDAGARVKAAVRRHRPQQWKGPFEHGPLRA